MKNDVQLLKIVVDFLSRLSDEQVNDLLNKNARLTLEAVSKKKDTPKSPQDEETLANICAQINAFSTREDAQTYFATKKFSKKMLQTIAKSYDIALTSKDSRETITNKIIETLIGSKLRFDALLTTDLSK